MTSLALLSALILGAFGIAFADTGGYLLILLVCARLMAELTLYEARMRLEQSVIDYCQDPDPGAPCPVGRLQEARDDLAEAASAYTRAATQYQALGCGE